MIIRNRTFFIAENVSDHNRMRLAKEILMRGGILIRDPEQQTDYEIFDAEKEYTADNTDIHRRSSVRISVNEMTRMIDCAPSAGADEFCIRKGELCSWIPEEHHGNALIIPAGAVHVRAEAFMPVYPCQGSVYRKAALQITRIVLPKTLQSIETDAFSCFTNLKRVIFPDRLKEVNGFGRCRRLEEVILPMHCEKIGDRAFAGCVSLKEVVWNEKIREIGSSAFQRTAIQEFHSMQSLEKIGAYAFAGCRDLGSLTLEGNTLCAETGAFKNSGIHELKIRMNSCELKSSCFKGCAELRQIDTGSTALSFTPSSFDHNVISDALMRIQNKDCTKQYAKIWMDMIRTHSNAFFRQTDPILLWKYSDILEPLIEKDPDDSGSYMKKLIRLEAKLRLGLLKKQCGLTPLVLKRYGEGKLYYSYLTARGLIGSIDTVTYDPLYEKTVHDAQSMYGIHVYHCVESTDPWHTLALLYVGSEPENWNYERPEEGIMPAYVHNFELDEGEFGDVSFTAYDGVLVRTG